MSKSPALTSTSSNVDDREDQVGKTNILLVVPQTNLIAGDDFVGDVLLSLLKTLPQQRSTVSLLILDYGSMSQTQISNFVLAAEGAGLVLRYIVRDKYAHFAGPKAACDSYMFYRWLADNDEFDVVHAPDLFGLTYYAQLAKRQGLAFERTHFVIDVFGASLWRKSLDQSFIPSPEWLAVNFLEQKSVQMADSIFSPARIYFDALESSNFSLPERRYSLELTPTGKLAGSASAAATSEGAGCEEAGAEEAGSGGAGAAAAGGEATGGNATAGNAIHGEASSFNRLEEIVCLGVLGERDGLNTFCDALDQLTEEIPGSSRISFVSSFDAFGGAGIGTESSSADNEASDIQEEYLVARSKRWPWVCQFVRSHRPQEWISYAKNGGKLIVLPSGGVGSLVWALHCAYAGVPYFCSARSTGSIDFERSGSGYLKQHLFAAHEDLRKKILAMLGAPLGGGLSLGLTPQHQQWWSDAHQVIFKSVGSVLSEQQPGVSAALGSVGSSGVSAASGAAGSAGVSSALGSAGASNVSGTSGTADKPPLVTVCMAHFNRPHFLRIALDSLMAQDYKELEVIVGDDGSDAPGVQEALNEIEIELKKRNWRILRLPHRDVGATRTSIAEAARGEYLLFMDDDNIAMGHEISSLIKVSLRTNADIVTCCFNAFEGENHVEQSQKPFYTKVFLGAAPECGLTENVFGDANALIKKSVYLELGGFDNQAGVAWHDWVFFAKATLRGLRLELVPEPLFWYRVSGNSMNRSSAEWLSAQPLLNEFVRVLPRSFEHFPGLLYGLARRAKVLESKVQELSSDRKVGEATALEVFEVQRARSAEPGKMQAVAEAVEATGATGEARKEAAKEADQAGVIPGYSKSFSRSSLQRLWKLVTLQSLAKSIRQHNRAKQLSQSDLFDAAWYVARYGVGATDPAYHYISVGSSRGFSPGPSFNDSWYRERYKQDDFGDLSPLEHFLQFGKSRGYLATPEEHELFKEFDPVWYTARNPDVSSEGYFPFVHYLLFGQAEGRAPSEKLDEQQNFDSDWYMARYPDLDKSKVDPFEHYCEFGRKEGRFPRPDVDPAAEGFDEAWYSQRYPDLADTKVPPLLHYLLYGRKEGRLKKPVDGPGSAAHTVRKRFPDQEVLPVFAVPKIKQRVNIVIDGSELTEAAVLFDSFASAIIFSALWSEFLGAEFRVLIRRAPFVVPNLERFFSYHGLSKPTSLEVSFLPTGDCSEGLPASRADLFVTTSWRATESVLRAVSPEQIIYFIQEDERASLCDREDYLRCTEILSNKSIRYIIDSSLLKQFLCGDGFDHLTANSVSFEPIVSEHFAPHTSVLSSVANLQAARDGGSSGDELLANGAIIRSDANSSDESGRRKNLFFLARPCESRTLYYRGLEVISRAIERNVLPKDDWDIYFVGEELTPLVLPNGVNPRYVQHHYRGDEFDQHLALLGRMDLGLSLMLSPHPGYSVLELAACGSVVVTNQYANKKTLDAFSKNILCAQPSVASLLQALSDGVNLVGSSELRLANYVSSPVSRRKDWRKAFEDIFSGFLARTLG